MTLRARLPHYWRLMRMHRPIGIWLLLWPTLWALWFAAGGMASLPVLIVFVLGTVLMRAAGCVINDIADRDFDPHVARTRERPIAAGQVGVREALVLFALNLAFNQVVVKVTNGGFGPVFLAGLRSVGGAVVLVLWMKARGVSFSLPRSSVMAGVISGALFAIEFMCLFTALALTTVGRVSIIFYSMPVWLALSAHVLLPTERLNSLRSIGLVLAMAFRIILPPLTSEFLNIIKNSAVALTIGLVELTARARSMQEFSFQVFEAFTAATILYLVINAIVLLGMRWVEGWVAVPGFVGKVQAGAGH